MRRIYLEQAESTNTYLKDLCRAGVEHGTVVYTWNQLSGYGRRGRYWHSEADKNIAMSIVLKLLPTDINLPMSIVAGVAVHWVLLKAVSAVSIKWPNDIMIDSRKLCGISCEKINGANGQFFVVGAGINVNNGEFPAELADTATSLYLHTGTEWDMQPILDDIIKKILFFYELCEQGDFANVLERFKQYCQNIGRQVSIIHDNQITYGEAVDIDDDGGIYVRNLQGKLEKFNSGEVSLRNY